MCPHDISMNDTTSPSPADELGETVEQSNSQIRIAYPSDISERQWQRIKPRVSVNYQRGRSRSTDIREVINGINYRWNTGCVWRMLPHDFPPWRTIYSYFHRWQQAGVLGDLRDVLLKRDRRISRENQGESQSASRLRQPGSRSEAGFSSPEVDRQSRAGMAK